MWASERAARMAAATSIPPVIPDRRRIPVVTLTTQSGPGGSQMKRYRTPVAGRSRWSLQIDCEQTRFWALAVQCKEVSQMQKRSLGPDGVDSRTFRVSRRRFLQASAASLALSSISANAFAAAARPAQTRRADRRRVVRQERSLAADPGGAGRGRIDLRSGSADAGRSGRDRTASGRSRARRPRTYGDYREMLKEKDLDIVLIGSPDHWHALQMIAAVEAGADVYVQKPISVDVREGEAMVAAARKHGRVVQVGTQRKSTPHLIDVKKQVVDAGLLGTIGHVEMCCYFHMRANGNPPVEPVPDFLDYEMWTGPAPLRPYDGLPHKRWWRTFMEYGNGIMGDMCVHMLDTARWMLGPRLAESHHLDRRHPRAEGGQVEHRRHADRHVRVRRLQRRLAAPVLGLASRSRLSLGAVHLRRQGNAEGQHDASRLHSARTRTPSRSTSSASTSASSIRRT